MSLNKPQLAFTLAGSIAALSSTACNDSAINDPNPPIAIEPQKPTEKQCPPQKECPEPNTIGVMCETLNTQIHSSLFQVSTDGNSITDLCSKKEYPTCQHSRGGNESDCSKCDDVTCNIWVDNDSYVYPMQPVATPQAATRLRLINGTLAICLDPPRKYDWKNTNGSGYSTHEFTGPNIDAGVPANSGIEHFDRDLLNEQIDHDSRSRSIEKK